MKDCDWSEYSHPPTYWRELTANGSSRLVVGMPSGMVAVFTMFIQTLKEPFLVLYVLHTPRGEAEPGRYQSPALSAGDLQQFLERFSDFFTQDARFDLWIHSSNSDATVVWDRHDLLFAYGLLDLFESKLKTVGFIDRKPIVPTPHAHHYRQEYDADAREILSFFEWWKTALKPEDEQV